VDLAKLKREINRGFEADLDCRLRDDERRAARLRVADERARRLEQMRAAHCSEAEEGESFFGHRIRS